MTTWKNYSNIMNEKCKSQEITNTILFKYKFK